MECIWQSFLCEIRGFTWFVLSFTAGMITASIVWAWCIHKELTKRRNKSLHQTSKG